MHLQAGAETILMNRHTLSKTYSGEEFSLTEKDVNLKPGVWMESMYSKRAVNICFLYKCRTMDIKVAIKTKARTPFFLSGPKFGFVFHKYSVWFVKVTDRFNSVNTKVHKNKVVYRILKIISIKLWAKLF